MRQGKEARAYRRAAALVRQAAREQRTAEEQLVILAGRPGESKRERTRLQAQLKA